MLDRSGADANRVAPERGSALVIAPCIGQE